MNPRKEYRNHISPKSPKAENLKTPIVGRLGDTKLINSALDKLNMPFQNCKVLNDDKDSLMISSGFKNCNLDSSLELIQSTCFTRMQIQNLVRFKITNRS